MSTFDVVVKSSNKTYKIYESDLTKKQAEDLIIKLKNCKYKAIILKNED